MLGAERDVVRRAAGALAQQRRRRGAAQGVAIDRSRPGHPAVPVCCLKYSIAQLKTQYVSAGPPWACARPAHAAPVRQIRRRCARSRRLPCRTRRATALHMPRIASAASRGSASARNSPLRMPCADHLLEDRLDGARELADPPPARVGQELALGEEYAHEVAAVEQRRDMRADQPCKLFARRSGSGRDRLLGLEEARDALHADMLQRHLLGGEIVVQARLPDAEQVRDVLRAGAVIAALGKHPRGRFHDLARAAAGIAFGPDRGAAGRAARGDNGLARLCRHL